MWLIVIFDVSFDVLYVWVDVFFRVEFLNKLQSSIKLKGLYTSIMISIIILSFFILTFICFNFQLKS